MKRKVRKHTTIVVLFLTEGSSCCWNFFSDDVVFCMLLDQQCRKVFRIIVPFDIPSLDWNTNLLFGDLLSKFSFLSN